MSTKVKRKVTVENNKDNADQHRRPSVFERLGPGAVSVGNTQQQERHNRAETQEKCRNWLRSGVCSFGSSCRYLHDPFPNSSSRRNKSEKEIPEKDLRHKVRNKRDDNKESRTRSLSPKRKGSKRSGSRSRKGEHESKIKSTVVVTRPRSPATKNAEPQDREKKKIDGTWEDDSDDWPLDSTQLDYKEELTLERKRQQLQRELELEYQKERMMHENQKERMMNENVTITKTVSFSESSSSSSSSESGSISTTSDSSSSSSDDDSDDSSSSSSSSSSSASRPPKKKSKKPASTKDAEMSIDSSSHQKPQDDYDKIKSRRAAKIGITTRSPIPSPEPPKSGKKGRDRRAAASPPLPSPKHSRFTQESVGSGRMKSRVKGPHTPSPPHSRKQRQWEQSSSADSRSADARQARGKRHKKKRDAPRNDGYSKSERAPTPPPQLSSPNRTALLPNAQFTKKNRQKMDDLVPKSRQRNRDSPPLLLSRMSGHSNSPSTRVAGGHGHHSLERDRTSESLMDRSKMHMRKPPDDLSQPKRSDSREQMSKRSRFSPRRDGYRDTLSPPRGKMESDGFLGGNSRKPYSSPVLHLEKGDDRNDRRRRSPSPVRGGKDLRDRRSFPGEFDKKRELREPSPRTGRDNLHRSVDSRNYPRKDNDVGKRGMSPDVKKGRDEKGRDRAPRDRNIEHDPLLWNEDHKKSSRSNSANRPGDGRGWQDVPQLPPNSRGDRPRDKERDRKKGKERDMPHRAVEEGDKARLPSPIRGRSPLHGHHPLPEVDAPLPSQRSRMYEPDIPPGDREYGYPYDAHRDPIYVNERLLPPEYEPDMLRGPPVYGPEGYPEGGRYRRDPPLKEQGPLPRDRVGGYNSRDGVSSRDMLPAREIERRNDDYLPDVPIDERHAYEERWARNRPMREEWDPYSGLPPPHPPPSSLEEDRYGMPRRRRGSPDWQMRNDDRELPMSPANHRPGNHPPLPPGQRPEQRGSRSPPPKRMGDSSRGSWGERPGRNNSRGSDNRHDLQQKNQDDKKGRNGRRDHRDRSRRRDGAPVPENKPPLNKDKPGNKRPHSPSPLGKDNKKRKEDIPSLESTPVADKNLPLSKRPREEPKVERKPPVPAPGIKPVKPDPPSPKGNTNSRSALQDKVDTTQKNSSNAAKPPVKPEKEEKKVKRPVFPVKRDMCRPEDLLKRYGMIDDKSQDDDDDDFSDWSDGDDDLLNRDDFNEVDIGDDFDKSKNKSDAPQQDKPKKDSNPPEAAPKSAADNNSRVAAGDQLDSAKVKVKDVAVSQPSLNRSGSKERVIEDSVPSNKEKEPVQELKEYEAIDSFMVKDETDTDDYITTECVDYDPISDDELEALIEEPDDQTIVKKQEDKNENCGIVDALDVNWSTLMSESRTKTDFVPGFARKRFKAAHVLSRIGFSQTLAGPEMTEKVLKFCQEQLDQELAEQNENSENGCTEMKKFVMEHHVAAFHVAISESKKERAGAFNYLGPNRRALCARKDLQIRKLLCQPINKLVDQTPATYRQQSNVDKDLYKKSLELLNLRKSEYQARTVDVC